LSLKKLKETLSDIGKTNRLICGIIKKSYNYVVIINIIKIQEIRTICEKEATKWTKQ